MSRAIRTSLSAVLLAALGILPGGCASTPPMPPETIPTLVAPPTMTGNLGADAWTGCLRLDLGPNTYALLGRATDPADGKDYVYVGVSGNDFVPTNNTRVVLGLVTKPVAPSCGWKVHLFPIPATAAGGPISGDEFWRSITGWNTGGQIAQPPNPGWPFPNTKVWAQGGGTNAWSLETRIYVNPANNNMGVWFPAAGVPWSLYVNVLNNGNAGAPGNVQFPWPAGCTMLGDIRTHTPDFATWGLAQF